MTVATAIQNKIREFPDNEAIVCDGRKYTYAEVGNVVNDISSKLLARGFTRHDTVGVLSFRSELSVFLYTALLNIGTAYIPLDETSPKERLADICKFANVKFVVGDILSSDYLCEFDVEKIYFDINLIYHSRGKGSTITYSGA